MLEWVTPDGLMIVEVPNVTGLGALLFGRYGSGLDFPRHLVHFTPLTMQTMIERAGGRIVGAVHRTKPRYLIRSMRLACADGASPIARGLGPVLASRTGRGVLKLALEIAMPVARLLGRGEAVRYFIRKV